MYLSLLNKQCLIQALREPLIRRITDRHLKGNKLTLPCGKQYSDPFPLFIQRYRLDLVWFHRKRLSTAVTGVCFYLSLFFPSKIGHKNCNLTKLYIVYFEIQQDNHLRGILFLFCTCILCG